MKNDILDARLKLINRGFNYSQDGPGNRLVYHIYGCNMLCPWCANPEGMNGDVYEHHDISELLSEIIDAKPLFFENGGVTFSGGEPTLQHKPLLALLKKVKENNINTAIETNATSAHLLQLSQYLDLVIADIKHYDDEKHKAFTGVGLAAIVENIKSLAQCKKQLWLRTPLINGFNADEKDIYGFVNLAKELCGENVVFEFLPYHEYGKLKWEALGREYGIKNGAVSLQRLAQFEAAFKEQGLNINKS